MKNKSLIVIALLSLYMSSAFAIDGVFYQQMDEDINSILSNIFIMIVEIIAFSASFLLSLYVWESIKKVFFRSGK